MSDPNPDKTKPSVDTQQGEIFVGLLIEHEPRVRGFLRGLLPTWNDVDEVIQEASLVAWRKFGDFEPGTAFGGWFLTIARFEALKHRRRLARTPLVFSEDLVKLLAEEASDDPFECRQQYLESCLESLRPQQREVLLKAYTPGVVMRELAMSSGKTDQAFYKTIQRLRAILLACVTKSISLENA